MKPTIVVPTYWGAPGKDIYLQEKVVFDHPTPLNTDGTLPAFLGSLQILTDQNFHVVIVAVPNSEQVVEQVIEKVSTIVGPFRGKFEITVIHPENLKGIRERLHSQGLPLEVTELLTLSNYAAVRNICSLAGILNNSPFTIFIDDDEVFVDPEFLAKAEEFLGKEYEGQIVHAVAGYYLQPNTYRIENKSSPEWAIPQWDKVSGMNEAFDRVIGSAPRLKVTPFVFGGNMVIDLETLMKVPFDPRITRGEDIDFLINLRIAGISFYLDNQLAIKHLPPSAHRPDWKNLREDVIRFLYEREKVSAHHDRPGLQPENFDPYPGMFLHDDLKERIVYTAEKLLARYQQNNDEQGVTECRKLIEMAENNPFQNLDIRAWLKELTQNWQRLTAAVQGMGISE